MEKIEPTIIDELSQSLEIDLREKKSIEELKIALSVYINHLIINDLNKLMQILYRVDVSEKTLKINLQNQENDPGSIIAEMIVERQLEKIKTKKQFRSNTDIPDNEKW
jgi:predicted RNA-binding protein Jag